MFKTLLTGACLMAVLAGCASAPQNRTGMTANANALPPHCLATGSRVPRDKTDCAAFGRTYSGEELQRTGMTDVGHALEMLDPEISVR